MPGLFERWKAGLSLSRKTTFDRVVNFFGSSEITRRNWEDLEALLLQADLGLETTSSVLSELQRKLQQNGMAGGDELRACLQRTLRTRLEAPPPLEFNFRPTVILVVGVNGSGKTTSIAKLAHRLRGAGKSVLIIGADTFRAAATDQLGEWARRYELPVFLGAPGSDPGSVVYDGIQSAVSRGSELVLIDTAGRLNTRTNLMEELKKVVKVAGKACPGAPHAVWLVLDATTGQNALTQARVFTEAVGVNGIILAKLDGSSKGGMVFAIRQQVGVPVLFAALGEGIEDLEVFDPDEFVQGIMAR